MKQSPPTGFGKLLQYAGTIRTLATCPVQPRRKGSQCPIAFSSTPAVSPGVKSPFESGAPTTPPRRSAGADAQDSPVAGGTNDRIGSDHDGVQGSQLPKTCPASRTARLPAGLRSEHQGRGGVHYRFQCLISARSCSPTGGSWRDDFSTPIFPVPSRYHGVLSHAPLAIFLHRAALHPLRIKPSVGLFPPSSTMEYHQPLRPKQLAHIITFLGSSYQIFFAGCTRS